MTGRFEWEPGDLQLVVAPTEIVWANRKPRAAVVRRARTAAKRQARILGATSPEQVGEIIERVLRERGLTP